MFTPFSPKFQYAVQATMYKVLNWSKYGSGVDWITERDLINQWRQRRLTVDMMLGNGVRERAYV